MHYLTSVLLLLFLSFPAPALAEFLGTVTGVKDGDTIIVLDDENRPVKVRLQGIDAPELKQPYGRAAKRYASGLVYGKTVTVTQLGTDRYGRVLGDVTLPDGRNFQEEMLKAGYAWHYKKYNDSQKFADLENEAHAAGLGLWADLNPTPPWEYRQQERFEKNETYRVREYHPRRRTTK